MEKKKYLSWFASELVKSITTFLPPYAGSGGGEGSQLAG